MQDVQVSITVTVERVRDMLCGAFEGGSLYWMEAVEENPAKGSKHEYFHEIPTYGGSLTVATKEPLDGGTDLFKLDEEAIVKGLEVMSELKHGEGGHHFWDMVQGNDDSDTADCFLQCCLFGKVIFG